MPVNTSQNLPLLFPAHLAALMERTSRALQGAGYGSLLLHAGSPSWYFADDHGPPFKAIAPFQAWLPLADAPEALLFFEPGRKPVLLFPLSDDYWHKTAPLPQDYWAGSFDIRPVRSRDEARAALPANLAATAFIGQAFAELGSWGVAAVNPAPLTLRMDFDRARKSEYELECLREANRIGARGHRAAELAFRAGRSEFEIELAFLAACGQREQELPYNPIIALNEGGSTLHYQVLERAPPPQHRSLLIDAGASFAGFGSDITRTHAGSDADFAALIAALDRLQLQLCAELAPGADWRDVHVRAYRLIAALLADADIVRTSAEHCADSGLAGVFFPHGLGHLLGLQVHDVGGLLAGPDGTEIPRPAGHPFLRLTRRLEPGFVVTVEPGVYFIDALLRRARDTELGRYVNWTRVAALKPFGGVRIEDDVAVTASGSENLTRPAFAALSAS